MRHELERGGDTVYLATESRNGGGVGEAEYLPFTLVTPSPKMKGTRVGTLFNHLCCRSGHQIGPVA